MSDIQRIQERLDGLHARAKRLNPKAGRPNLSIKAGGEIVAWYFLDEAHCHYAKTADAALDGAERALAEIEHRHAAETALLARTLDVDGTMLPEAREVVHV